MGESPEIAPNKIAIPFKTSLFVKLRFWMNILDVYVKLKGISNNSEKYGVIIVSL